MIRHAIEKLRIYHGLKSDRALATLLGITPTTLCTWKDSKKDIPIIIVEHCKNEGLSLEQLLFDDTVNGQPINHERREKDLIRLMRMMCDLDDLQRQAVIGFTLAIWESIYTDGNIDQVIQFEKVTK